LPTVRPVVLLLPLLLALPAHAATLELAPPTSVAAVAVAETPQGLVGSVATVDVSRTTGRGSGEIFLSTHPLAEIDMQGSARLAVRVAGAATGIPVADKDFFLVIRSPSPMVGGPSAGAILAVAAMASLASVPVRNDVFMTGTVSPVGDVGPIGGLAPKIQAARDAGGRLFLYPEAQDTVTVLRMGSAGEEVRTLATADFCQEIGIPCIPVGEVETAFRHFTGYELSRPGRIENVSFGDFVSVLAPEAAGRLERAGGILERARANLTAASLGSPERAAAQDAIGRSERLLDRAGNASGGHRYYTAASLAFQAAIEARLAEHLVAVASNPSPEEALARIETAARREAEEAFHRARAVEPTTLSELGGVGAAQERASEARSLVGRAQAAREQGQHGNALRLLAQAVERTSTALWWLELAQHLRGGQPLSRDELSRAAEELLSTATETLAYARVILRVEPGPGDALSEPAELLARARADLKEGAVAGAIFVASNAAVQAGLALERAGLEDVPEAKLARARERAAVAILQARERGVEPVLALSLFEFAGDQPPTHEGRQAALGLYATARASAMHHAVVRDAGGPRELHFVGHAVPPGPDGAAVRQLVSAFAMGAAVATMLALPFVVLRKR